MDTDNVAAAPSAPAVVDALRALEAMMEPGMEDLTLAAFEAAAEYDQRVMGWHARRFTGIYWRSRMNNLARFVTVGPRVLNSMIDDKGREFLNSVDLPDSWDVSPEEWLMRKV